MSGPQYEVGDKVLVECEITETYPATTRDEMAAYVVITGFRGMMAPVSRLRPIPGATPEPDVDALVEAARAIHEAEIADRPARATLSGATYALVPLALYMPLKQAVEELAESATPEPASRPDDLPAGELFDPICDLQRDTRRPTTGDTVRMLDTERFRRHIKYGRLRIGDTAKIDADDHSILPYLICNFWYDESDFELIDAEADGGVESRDGPYRAKHTSRGDVDIWRDEILLSMFDVDSSEENANNGEAIANELNRQHAECEGLRGDVDEVKAQVEREQAVAADMRSRLNAVTAEKDAMVRAIGTLAKWGH